MNKYLILFKNDMRNIFRDKIMLVMFFYPVVFIVLFRWLANKFVELNPYLPLILSFCYILMPMMLGAVLGFMILDEKDDQIINALRIMPISSSGFLAYRLVFPMVFVFIVNLVMPYILDFVSLTFSTILMLALMSSLESPLLGLFISARAHNKVEGMAMLKFSGFAFLLPIAATFITSNWQWFFGLLPTFWIIKIVLESSFGTPNLWIFIIGFIYHIFLVILVGFYFKKTTLDNEK